MSDIGIIIVTYNSAAEIGACLDAALASGAETVVVDNASTDGTAALLAQMVSPECVIRLPANTGFAGGVAAALPHVRTRYCALLNDDAVADPDWLAQLLAAAAGDDGAAAWTSLMVLADRPGTVNNLGAGLDERWYGIDVCAGAAVERIDPGITDVFGFCGGAALLRTAAIRAVGGFPAEFFLYYEDLDTSWRLRLAGWSIRAVPVARVVHRHAATSNRRSELFHFHNERNRLLTLLRCAPASIASAQLLRFALTTGSLAAGRLLGRSIPDEQNFRVRLRLRILVAVLRLAPQTVLRRRGTRVTRRAVARFATVGPPRPVP